MEINIGMDKLETNSYSKEWGGLRYQALMKSPKKMGTQELLNKIISENTKVELSFKDTGEKVKVYLNEEYISHVLDSKYNTVSIALENLDHADLNVEIQKNGDYKVTPYLFYNIPN